MLDTEAPKQMKRSPSLEGELRRVTLAKLYRFIVCMYEYATTNPSIRHD